MVYEVDIERDGKNRELHIAADGTILKDTDRGAVGAPGTIERGAALTCDDEALQAALRDEAERGFSKVTCGDIAPASTTISRS